MGEVSHMISPQAGLACLYVVAALQSTHAPGQLLVSLGSGTWTYMPPITWPRACRWRGLWCCTPGLPIIVQKMDGITIRGKLWIPTRPILILHWCFSFQAMSSLSLSLYPFLHVAPLFPVLQGPQRSGVPKQRLHVCDWRILRQIHSSISPKSSSVAEGPIIDQAEVSYDRCRKQRWAWVKSGDGGVGVGGKCAGWKKHIMASPSGPSPPSPQRSETSALVIASV